MRTRDFSFVQLFLVVALAGLLVVCLELSHRVYRLERAKVRVMTSSTVARVGLVCELPDGRHVNTGPAEAARLHLRCRP